MTSVAFAGVRFDGITAAKQPVEVSIAGRELVVIAGGAAPLRVAIASVHVSERFAAAPRIVGLGDAGTIELADPDGRFDRALQAAGVLPGAVQRMQAAWPAALTSLACLVVLVIYAYVHGIPAVAHWLAYRLPQDYETRIGDEVLRQMDKHVLAPSALPYSRRAELSQRFSEVAAKSAPGTSARVEFRHMRDSDDDVNAMALPNGTIVLLDGLVTMAEDDDALIGVLAHELGHIAGKHSMRQLIQSVGVGSLAALLWGDFSAVIANVPMVFGVLNYSRAMETEADDFAVRALAENGISAEPLIELFDAIEKKSREDHDVEPPAFLSTHPPTAERQKRLRGEKP